LSTVILCLTHLLSILAVENRCNKVVTLRKYSVKVLYVVIYLCLETRH